MRRRAKAINFGIIYGISAFGLANQLGIPREEAGAYIKKYFERFPGIRDYMDATQEAVRAPTAIVTTHVRPQDAISRASTSTNPSERAFVERAAINAPIQGTAADIIRRAMIRMDGALDEAQARRRRCCCRCTTNWSSRRPTTEVEATIALVAQGDGRSARAGACKLGVPLQVDARAADNWDEAH